MQGPPARILRRSGLVPYIVVIKRSSPDEVLSAALGLGRLHIARLPMTDNEIRQIPDSGQPRSGGRGSLRRNNPGHYRPFHIRSGLGWQTPVRELGLGVLKPIFTQRVEPGFSRIRVQPAA